MIAVKNKAGRPEVNIQAGANEILALLNSEGGKGSTRFLAKFYGRSLKKVYERLDELKIRRVVEWKVDNNFKEEYPTDEMHVEAYKKFIKMSDLT